MDSYDASAAAAAGGFGFFTLIWLAIAVFLLVAYWKMFVKAGRPGWTAIIPIYNVIVLMQIIGKPEWWFLLFLIPGVNIVFCIIAMIALARAFGKSDGFAIGLFLLPFVFIPMLAFGNAQYQGPAKP